MSNKPFEAQFRKDIDLLTRAVYRVIDLDFDQPKVYKKVKKYFQNQGIEFYDEPEADYELVLSLLREELKLDVPA